MQSSYNVIKNNFVIPQGNKEIVTNIENIKSKVNIPVNGGAEQAEVIDARIQNAEVQANRILAEAQVQRDQIVSSAMENAKALEREACQKGYEAGSQQGYRDGYEKAAEDARAETDGIINTAKEMLFNAKLEYENYLEDKKEEIILMALNMAETVLKRELSSREGLNEIILEVLKNSRNTESIIIRANKFHCEEIKDHLNEWKENLVLKGELFVVADESIGAYDAVIEKNNGKVVVGLKPGIDGLRQALL